MPGRTPFIAALPVTAAAVVTLLVGTGRAEAAGLDAPGRSPPARPMGARASPASPWLGSASCGTCHPRELAAWKRTPHAQHTPRPTAAQGACLSCHTTGDAPAGPVSEQAIGCESCHGAGRFYAEADVMRDPALARSIGLADLGNATVRRALCVRCHGFPTLPSTVDWTAPVHPIGTSSSGSSGTAPGSFALRLRLRLPVPIIPASYG